MNNKNYMDAISLALEIKNKFYLDDFFVESIKARRLEYSVALCPQNEGVRVNINKDYGLFSEIVSRFERSTSCLVYHCLLSGPFFSMLFVDHTLPVEPTLNEQGEILAAVVDIDSQDLNFMYIRLARLGAALVRID